jgi:UDP-N-acetylmuramoyl-L-alanyl-D-glutamate--2,6-diaminopimelate ligase
MMAAAKARKQGEPEITGLTADSRQVKPGYLFAALPGVKSDGRQYIAQAVRNGAAAVLVPSGTVIDPGLGPVAVIESAEPRRSFALLAAQFYKAQPEMIVAVTGTSGKSSTVHFARQLWTHMGLQAASLGTTGISAPGYERYGSLTTPDPASLHGDLAMLAQRGVTHLAMEASSHGLDQFRLDGVRVQAGAFTNFSRDHLDYHLDFEAYFAAKLRLFQSLIVDGGTAVLNADIPEYRPLRAASEARGLAVMGYGESPTLDPERDLVLAARTPLPTGQTLDLKLRGRAYRMDLPLMGTFQAMNVLAALGLVLATGGNDEAAMKAVPKLTGVPGRVERVAATPNGAAVYVDYAHKPGALETMLTALRPHVKGRLVLVFGCGGDRDRGKRPIMGEIATRLADKVYVTDDNPRSETPATIRAEIMTAAPDAVEIGDRAEAIAAAVRELQPTDMLVVAGKGHERGQIVGDTVIPFDDAEVARKAVANLG